MYGAVGRRIRYAWHNSHHPALARLRRWADDAPIRLPYVTSRLPGHPLVLGYAGLTDGLTHVLPFLEERRGGNPDQVSRETAYVSRRALEQGVELPDCDLLAIGMLSHRANRLPRERALVLPLRVHLVVPVVSDPQEMRRRISRKERQQAARGFRERGWTLEVTGSDADFDHFYDAIHLPTMAHRHGPAARSMDREMARECLLRRGVLLLLREGDQRIAGMLCRYGPASDTLTLRLAGVLEGRQQHYDHGALAAMYSALIEWAAGQGIRRLDLSGCEPFLSKGIFQFKRKFHPQVELPRTHFRDKRLWLGIRRDTPAVRDLLVANPFLVAADDTPDTWHAVYFHDALRPPRRELRWECPRVTAAHEVDLDAFMAGDAFPPRRTSLRMAS